MKLLRVIKSLMPRVELRPIKHLSTDLRNPWEIGLREHKRRRARECRKVAAAQSSSMGGRGPGTSTGGPQLLSGCPGLKPTALQRYLSDPAFLRRQAN